MSFWTYVNGMIDVEPMGRTQEESEYVLKTVLNHLPLVTGSEENMYVHIVQKGGHNFSSGCNEFGELNEWHSKEYINERQTNYILAVEGHFRDRFFEQTYNEFVKWLCRLAKRVMVNQVLVKIDGYDKSIIINEDEKYFDMFENPTWTEGEGNWCEYLMWGRDSDSDYPEKLLRKYKN